MQNKVWHSYTDGFWWQCICFVCLFGQLRDASECTRSAEGVADDGTGSMVMGATAQCIYVLYGLDLPERNEQWTEAFQVGALFCLGLA